MVKLKLETMIELEDGAVPVADLDYDFVSDLINAIRERISLMTLEQEYTFYKYVFSILKEVEFIEGDD